MHTWTCWKSLCPKLWNNHEQPSNLVKNKQLEEGQHAPPHLLVISWESCPQCVVPSYIWDVPAIVSAPIRWQQLDSWYHRWVESRVEGHLTQVPQWESKRFFFAVGDVANCCCQSPLTPSKKAFEFHRFRRLGRSRPQESQLLLLPVVPLQPEWHDLESGTQWLCWLYIWLANHTGWWYILRTSKYSFVLIQCYVY